MPIRVRHFRLGQFLLGLALGLAPLAADAQQAAPAKPAAAAPARRVTPAEGTTILATVNGDVISLGDVDNRRRLLALSAGLPTTPDVLDRLTPQVVRQLIDERLRLQEILRRKIVVPDQDIAAAIQEIEGRNGLPPGTLRRKLAGGGVDIRTMIDQIRVQLGWNKVLREVLGAQINISDADIKAQEAVLKAQVGHPEYRVAEIFVPVTDAAQAPDAQRFVDTVIGQLRAGAPFGVVAAQFSQSQNALSGGDLGWVQGNQLDPEVFRVVQQMPVGAISNPIRVAGGFSIITLHARRELGNEPAQTARVRQIFIPFPTKLNPAAPTDAQRRAVEEARAISANARSCEAMDTANQALTAKGMGSGKPADPGEIRVDAISVPALRQVITTLPLEKASEPLIAEDGVAVVMVCSRETSNMGLPSRQEIASSLLNDRVELGSRQLMRDLQRRAIIDRRA